MSFMSLIDEALQDALDNACISVDDIPADILAGFYASVYELNKAINTARPQE